MVFGLKWHSSRMARPAKLDGREYSVKTKPGNCTNSSRTVLCKVEHCGSIYLTPVHHLLDS